MNLNIIGNGFDLYHGLPSSYKNFARYLIKNEDEFYESFSKMYEIAYMEMIGPSIAHDYILTAEDMFWSCFEAKLADVSEDFVLHHIPDDLGLENPDPIEVELNDDMIAATLKRHFTNWIENTLNIDTNYELIKRYFNNSEYKIEFEEEDIFMQFNYTRTLETVYDIEYDNILYIHGESGGDLVVGHGNDEKILQIEKELEQLKEDYNYTQSQQNRITENKCILRYLRNTRKDTESCRRYAKWFFESRIENNLDEIRVFGLSLGDVDIPYLEDIRMVSNGAKWYFYCYSQEDVSKANFVATMKLELVRTDFEIMKFDNPMSNEINKTLSIIFNVED